MNCPTFGDYAELYKESQLLISLIDCLSCKKPHGITETGAYYEDLKIQCQVKSNYSTDLSLMVRALF